jgi:hypothetical protein
MRDVPIWYRVCDSSAPQFADFNEYPDPHSYKNKDGRPLSVHGWDRLCYGNDRAWMTFQDSTNTASSNMAQGVFAFNRKHPGVPQSPGSASYSAQGMAGPWQEFTTSPATPANHPFGPARFDPNHNRVISFGGMNTSGEIVAFDASDANIRSYHANSWHVFPNAGWAACCPDLNIMVVRNCYGCDPNNSPKDSWTSMGVAVLDLNDLSAPMQRVPAPGLPSSIPVPRGDVATYPADAVHFRWGAAYHPPQNPSCSTIPRYRQWSPGVPKAITDGSSS